MFVTNQHVAIHGIAIYLFTRQSVQQNCNFYERNQQELLLNMPSWSLRTRQLQEVHTAKKVTTSNHFVESSVLHTSMAVHVWVKPEQLCKSVSHWTNAVRSLPISIRAFWRASRFVPSWRFGIGVARAIFRTRTTRTISGSRPGPHWASRPWPAPWTSILRQLYFTAI